jgi:glycosyltransferase involved in cell wall biosynthesis
MTMKWNKGQRTLYASAAEGALPSDLVTVCVSAFNYERYIETALQSVLLQTHRALELIVVDDASDRDETREVATSWVRKNQRRFWKSTVLSNVRNQGPSLTRNVAFELASGEFIFVLDADNELYPRAISELYRAAIEGCFAATYTQLEIFGVREELGIADVFVSERLRERNYVDVMALIAKAAWESVGGFGHLELGWEDYDFWLKFAESGFSAGFLPEILCRYRTHGNSRTDKDAIPSHDILQQIMAIRHPRDERRARL